MTTLTLEGVDTKTKHTRKVPISKLVVAGWTGRDPEAVEAHVRELEALGVARPRQTPIYYRVANNLLTTSSSIQAVGVTSSGEAEFILIQLDDGIWVGVGSDHTDRELEKSSVTLSKQVCAKPISAQLWRYEDIAEHWDSLRLRSWATIDGTRRIYQDGVVASMLPPANLIGGYAGEELEPGTAMFCGTLPVQGAIEFASRFEIELEDPVLQRTLAHGYDVVPLPEEC